MLDGSMVSSSPPILPISNTRDAHGGQRRWAETGYLIERMLIRWNGTRLRSSDWTPESV
jgi:hypothetical protein